jgi:hypothetical protein
MPEPLPRTLATVELLRRAGGEIESTIRGDSMDPTLPAGARIRIVCAPAESLQDGTVAAFLAGDVMIGHRLVGRCRDLRHREALLLRGDARLVCDPPVDPRLVLGQVVAWQREDTWQPVAPATGQGPLARFTAAVILFAMRLVARIDLPLAGRLHESLLAAGLRVRSRLDRGHAPPG